MKNNTVNPEKDVVTAEELLISNMYEIQALINLLEKKGILNKEEILDEIKNLKNDRTKKIN